MFSLKDFCCYAFISLKCDFHFRFIHIFLRHFEQKKTSKPVCLALSQSWSLFTWKHFFKWNQSFRIDLHVLCRSQRNERIFGANFLVLTKTQWKFIEKILVNAFWASPSNPYITKGNLIPKKWRVRVFLTDDFGRLFFFFDCIMSNPYIKWQQFMFENMLFCEKKTSNGWATHFSFLRRTVLFSLRPYLVTHSSWVVVVANQMRVPERTWELVWHMFLTLFRKYENLFNYRFWARFFFDFLSLSCLSSDLATSRLTSTHVSFRVYTANMI